MKAILEFSLPEDQVEYNTCNQAQGMHSVLWGIDQFLRNKIKYGHSYLNADEALENVRNQLYELMSDYKVSLED